MPNNFSYVSWKGKSFSQITAIVRKNNTSLSSEISSSKINTSTLFKPHPYKIYRKEIVSKSLLNSGNSRPSIKIFDFETPGNNIVNSNIILDECNGISNVSDVELPEYTCNSQNTILKKKCLSAENNALRRIRNSVTITPSYTNYNQYLNSRNKTFEQNEYRFLKKENIAVTSQYESNIFTHCTQSNPSTTKYVPVYYKPSNIRFAQQGGVSSRNRMQRLKYDIITNAGLKLGSTIGNEITNQFSYSNTNNSIYSLNQKQTYPNKQTPVFSKVAGTLITCN